jgi:hypothetical protein
MGPLCVCTCPQNQRYVCWICAGYVYTRGLNSIELSTPAELLLWRVRINETYSKTHDAQRRDSTQSTEEVTILETILS